MVYLFLRGCEKATGASFFLIVQHLCLIFPGAVWEVGFKTCSGGRNPHSAHLGKRKAGVWTPPSRPWPHTLFTNTQAAPPNQPSLVHRQPVQGNPFSRDKEMNFTDFHNLWASLLAPRLLGSRLWAIWLDEYIDHAPWQEGHCWCCVLKWRQYNPYLLELVRVIKERTSIKHLAQTSILK